MQEAAAAAAAAEGKIRQGRERESTVKTVADANMLCVANQHGSLLHCGTNSHTTVSSG
jgi:hypothetical protein